MAPQSSLRLVGLKEVELLTGRRKSCIYNWMNPKHPSYIPDFPLPKKIGIRSIAWILADVENWILTRTAK